MLSTILLTIFVIFGILIIGGFLFICLISWSINSMVDDAKKDGYDI